MRFHRMDLVCPHCGIRTNAVTENITGPDRALPVEGDYSICTGCQGLNLFVNGPFGIAIRALTPRERAEADRNPDVREALRIARGES